MPTIPGENSVPQGRAGTGAAYVLGANTPSALSVLVNGQRQRALAAQREAALKLKQEQDAAKDLDNSLKYGTKGGALYQGALNTRVFNGLSDKLVAVERERMAGKLDMYAAKQQQANLKRNAEDEQTLSVAKQAEYQDAYKAVQADSKGRDATAYNVGYQGSLTRKKADGSSEALLPSEHDNVAAMQEQDNNPMTYVADEQLRRHVQGWQANTLADAHAGSIGGTHGANTLTYKGIVVDRQKDGSFAPRMENGRPVLDISQADLDRDRGGNHNLDMGIKRLEVEDAQRAVTEGRAPKDALTLYKEGLSKYVNFRQTESTGRNAQPHQPRSASGKPKATDILADTGEVGDYTHQVQYDDNSHDWSTAKPLYPGGLPINASKVYKQGIETLGGGMKPRTVGGKDITTAGAIFPEIGRPDSNGKMVYTKNDKPIAGSYQHYFYDAMDEKGHQIEGKTKAEKQQMINQGKAKEGMFVVVSGTGNKDYSAAVADNYKSLKATNDAKFGDSKKSDAELKAKAEDLAMKGSEILTVPYNGSTAPRIDPETQGFYRPAFQKMLQRRAAPQQQAVPNTKPARPAFLPTKTAAPKTSNPRNAAPADKSGGMM